MSLITLKNDNNQQPYNWRNYFKDPLILPPHSSVSLQNAVINKKDTIDVTDSENFYFRMGVNELNPTYSGTLASLDYDLDDLALAIKEELQETSGQLAFCNTDSTFPTLGWDFTYNSVPSSQNMTVRNEQNPMPLPEQHPLVTPPSAILYSAQNNTDPDWAKFRRNGNPPTGVAEETFGSLFAEGQIPRNGGHIIYRPFVLTAPFGTQYPTKTWFGITSSNKSISEVSYYAGGAGRPFGFGFFLDGTGLAPTTLRVTCNLGDLETDDQQFDKGTPLSMSPASQYSLCIEWVTPYSLLFKYSTNFDPAVPATDFENATWTTLYDMRDDTGVAPIVTKEIPTFQDNMGMIVRMPPEGANVWVRGTFLRGEDEMGNWSWKDGGLERSDTHFTVGTDVDVGADALVGVYPDQFIQKEMQILWETAPPIATATLDLWNNTIDPLPAPGQIVSTHLGTLLGFDTDQILTLTPNATFKINGATGNKEADPTNTLPTLHIQLTNFGIESKNGIVSNNVKDIAVVPLWEAAEGHSHQLHYQAGYENRVNLNNLQELTCNQIDVMLTTDDNKPATILKNFSTLVIKMHKGIEDADEGWEKRRREKDTRFGRFKVDNIVA